MTNAPDLAALRKLAEKATPGPWDVNYCQGAVRHITRNVDPGAFYSGEWDGWHRQNDGPFIAALDPATVLWLLDRAEDLERLKTMERKRWETKA